MPSFQRQVSFTPAAAYSRLPRDDEAYVMKAFARHASKCPRCAHPYEVHCQGGTLCPKGHQRAVDVAQYVYSKSGLAYSKVDREGNQRVQIEIPANCDAVRGLLKAIEHGLHRLTRAPVASYDQTYHIPARPVTQRQPSYLIRKPKLETAEPPAWGADSRRGSGGSRGSSLSYIGRGSLYASEMEDRERHASIKPSVYYRISREDGPPVPPKDYLWH